MWLVARPKAFVSGVEILHRFAPPILDDGVGSRSQSSPHETKQPNSLWSPTTPREFHANSMQIAWRTRAILLNPQNRSSAHLPMKSHAYAYSADDATAGTAIPPCATALPGENTKMRTSRIDMGYFPGCREVARSSTMPRRTSSRSRPSRASASCAVSRPYFTPKS